jgi:periplasmic divalent cation tolerance protein
MTPYLLCFVTIDDSAKAIDIARSLVNQNLAACVNIAPEVRSVYLWKGQVCDEAERLLIIKTRAELFDQLKTAVKEMHPYEVPEIIAIAIDNGLPEYLNWIDQCTAPRVKEG